MIHAMINLGPLELVIILIVIALPFLLVLGLVFAAIKHKNWVGLAALAVTVSVLLLGGSLAVWTTAQRIADDFGGVPDLEFLRAQTPVAATSKPLMAEVTSDEELAAVASAQPMIKLEEVSVPAEATNDEGDPLANAKNSRPDWIDAQHGDNQKLIVAGPYAYAQACQIETDQELQKWLVEKFVTKEVTSEAMRAVSSLALKNFKKEQYEETRETSVGEFYMLYTLAEVSPKSATQITESAKLMAKEAAQTARTRGTQIVTIAGAGVLSLVAFAHVVLKSGGRKAKNGAP